MTIMMKFLLIMSFLALTDAWFWRILPYKKGNLAAKSVDLAGQKDPAKLIIGALTYLSEGIVSLNDRVGVLERTIQDIEEVLTSQGGQEPGPDGTVNQEPSPDGQEAVRSDETIVRMLLRNLESRLEEKTREEKHLN